MKKTIAVFVGIIVLALLSIFYYPFHKTDVKLVPPTEALTAEKQATTIAVGLYLREGGKGNVSIDCLVHDQPIVLTATSTKNDCPFLREAVVSVLGDKNSIDMTRLERLMRIDAFYENDIPIRKYLYENHGTTSPEYALLYEDVILARNIGRGTVANQPKNKNAYDMRPLSREYFITAGYEANRVYTLDKETLGDGIDAIIYTDLLESGAYNLFSTVYTADFSNGEMVIRNPETISEHEHSLVRSTSNFVNIGFDQDKTLIESGMRAFGLYPCNSERNYLIKKDRIVLQNEKIKKACIGAKINGPADLDKLPTDFDTSPMVETYRISPALLQKALTAPLASFTVFMPVIEGQG